MRIGIFSECYRPVLNGVVVSIDTFKNELEKLGHEFIIITTEAYKETADHDDNKIFRVPAFISFEPKGGKYPIASWQSVGAWAKRLAPYNLDLIHSQHLLSLGSLGLKVAKRLRKPSILTYHTLLTEYGHYVPIFGDVAKNWLIKKSRDYCNQYDAVVTPSLSMKKLLIEYGVTTPISPIPTGIDLDNFKKPYGKDQLYDKFNIPKNQRFLFLYVSRIAKEKNIDFLLSAMKMFVDDRHHSDCHLLMVGGGDELDKIKTETTKLGLNDFVTFTGAQKKEETNKIFGGADVFVFASISETQGIIIQEAQAAGLPVIAVNKMGPSDSINNNKDGFLVPLNIETFVGKMEYLLDNENARLRMGKAALENTKDYTAQMSGKKMEKLYEKTINYYSSQSDSI